MKRLGRSVWVCVCGGEGEGERMRAIGEDAMEEVLLET